MAKRLLEPSQLKQNLLAQLSLLSDLWTLVLAELAPSDLYALKIATKALKPHVEQFLASLGPLWLLVWQCVKRCGYRSYQHCCGLGITPCLRDITPVSLQLTIMKQQYTRHFLLDALPLRQWRFHHGTDCNIQLAESRCPNWGSGSTKSRTHYWLDEATATLSFLEDWKILPSAAMPRAILCWTKYLDKRQAEEIDKQRTAPTRIVQ
jgi:hypothetical protein